MHFLPSYCFSKDAFFPLKRCFLPELLDALIDHCRQGALDYQEYLRQIVELTKQARI